MSDFQFIGLHLFILSKCIFCVVLYHQLYYDSFVVYILLIYKPYKNKNIFNMYMSNFLRIYDSLYLIDLDVFLVTYHYH